MKRILPCDCGGTFRAEKVAQFDFSPYADGLQVTLQNVPVLRCDRCGETTLDGAIIDGTLATLAQSIAITEGKLGGIELRFLRKQILLTQQELADRLGCNRVTVADWERDAQPISDHHLLRLRALVLGGDLHANLEKFHDALEAAFAAARQAQPGAERLLANAVALLQQAAQESRTNSAPSRERRVIDARKLDLPPSRDP